MLGGKKLFWLIVIIVIIVVGFVWWQKSAPKKVEESVSNTQQVMPKVDQAQLAADYKNSLRALMPAYKQALENPTAETISNTRQKLLDLKLPAEFFSLHHQLVYLLDQTEADMEKLNTAEYLKQLEDAVKNYDWLK